MKVNYNKIKEKITKKEYIRGAVTQEFKEGKSEDDDCAAGTWRTFTVNSAGQGGL